MSAINSENESGAYVSPPRFTLGSLFLVISVVAVLVSWCGATAVHQALAYVGCMGVVVGIWRLRANRESYVRRSAAAILGALFILCIGTTITLLRFARHPFEGMSLRAGCQDVGYDEYIRVSGELSARLSEATHIYFERAPARDGYEQWTKATLRSEAFSVAVKGAGRDFGATATLSGDVHGSAAADVLFAQAARRLGFVGRFRQAPDWWSKSNVTGPYDVAGWLPVGLARQRNRGRLWLYERASSSIWVYEWNWQH